MKTMVWVFVVALAFCPMVMASDIAFYIGQWNTDGWYSVSQFDDIDTIIAKTGYLFKNIQQFDDAQLDEFGAWVDENANDGEMDIIWLNGCMPSVLYPFPNRQPDGSRAEQWLDGGNMFMNVGDWFAYVSFEGGYRQPQNGDAGAANILDLPYWIVVFGDNTQLTVTPTGRQYLPSLSDFAPTDRPVVLSAVQAPWEVAAIFASTGGTEDPAAEMWADPVVLHNTETGGYVAFINQADGGPGGWIDDRGLTCAEFISNWVNDVIGLGVQSLPVPADGARIGDGPIVLSWAPGQLDAQYDVYFGTSSRSVEYANRWDTSGIYRGRLLENSYATEELALHQTYYWRIDEVEAYGSKIHQGDVWSFTVVDSLTVEYQVSAGDDDAYGYGDELQNSTKNYLRIGDSSFNPIPYYTSGMVFRHIEIPQGSEILNATFKIHSYDDRLTDTVYGVITAEAADDAVALGGSRYVSSLVTTNTSVAWDHFEPWVENTWYESPDIAEVVQEVIDRTGWSANNSLTIIYSTRQDDGGARNFSSYDRGSEHAPKLEITYVP
ncbi:MAG: hypothetical protein ACYS7Y_22905 [Planctomycetota bacterium]